MAPFWLVCGWGKLVSCATQKNSGIKIMIASGFERKLRVVKTFLPKRVKGRQGGYSQSLTSGSMLTPMPQGPLLCLVTGWGVNLGHLAVGTEYCL